MFLPDIEHKYQKFCSVKCRVKYNNRKIKARNPKRWRERRNFDTMQRRYRIKANGGKFTLEEWKQMKKDCNYTCPECHKSEPEIKLTIDHKIPLTRGGKHEKENIQPLCSRCNTIKGNKIAPLKSPF